MSAKLRVPDVRWSMNFRIGAICILLIASIAVIPPANAQGSEVESMFRDLEVKAANTTLYVYTPPTSNPIYIVNCLTGINAEIEGTSATMTIH